MQRITLAMAVISSLGLAACGDTIGEQALFGGAAGVGAAAVTNGDLATGAVIGALGNVAYCQTQNNCR